MKSASQMKLNPSLSPNEVEFHHEVNSSTEGGFIPPVRTDLVKKRPVKTGRFSGRGSWIRTSEMQESKSCALPLGDTPVALISVSIIS